MSCLLTRKKAFDLRNYLGKRVKWWSVTVNVLSFPSEQEYLDFVREQHNHHSSRFGPSQQQRATQSLYQSSPQLGSGGEWKEKGKSRGAG